MKTRAFHQLLSLIIVAIALTSVASCKFSPLDPGTNLSGEKWLSNFAFQGYAITPTVSSTGFTFVLPVGSTASNLIATFTHNDSSTVTVDGVLQVSGQTVNDFASAKTYLVTAEDGTTRSYTVQVTVQTAASKDMLTFSFEQLVPPVTATISGTTITATVPYMTDLSTLVPTYGSSGSSVTQNGTELSSGIDYYDFTIPLSFVVHAIDGGTQSYTVTVTRATAPTFQALGTAQGLPSTRVQDLDVSDGKLYAATDSGFAVSIDGGASWTKNTVASGPNALSVNHIRVSGTNIYAGTGSNGIFVSHDGGQTWSNYLMGGIDSIELDNTYVYVGASHPETGSAYSFLYKEPIGAEAFTIARLPASNCFYSRLALFGGTIYATGYDYGTSETFWFDSPTDFSATANSQTWDTTNAHHVGAITLDVSTGGALYEVRDTQTVDDQPMACRVYRKKSGESTFTDLSGTWVSSPGVPIEPQDISGHGEVTCATNFASYGLLVDRGSAGVSYFPESTWLATLPGISSAYISRVVYDGSSAYACFGYPGAGILVIR